jgi:hypothetical protein
VKVKKPLRYVNVMGLVAVIYLVAAYFLPYKVTEMVLTPLGGAVIVFLFRKALIADELPDFAFPRGRDFSAAPALRDLFRSGLAFLGTLICTAAYALAVRFRVVPDTWVGASMFLVLIIPLFGAFAFFLVRFTGKAMFGTPKRRS